LKNLLWHINSIYQNSNNIEEVGKKMKYFLGVDAGGTKTQCYVGDETGKVLGEGLGGPGNYQTSSIEKTKASILKSMNAVLRHLD